MGGAAHLLWNELGAHCELSLVGLEPSRDLFQ